MNRDELKEYFTLQMKLRELCDAAGISRPLSKREMEIGILALAENPPGEKPDPQYMDLSLAL